MILVVTPNLAVDCVEALRQATSEKIVMAASLAEAATLLRTDSYLAVVLDQYLLETEPDEAETVMRNLGTAIPLQVNFAISGGCRLGRRLPAAAQRRHRQDCSPRPAPRTPLLSQLNSTVTKLL